MLWNEILEKSPTMKRLFEDHVNSKTYPLDNQIKSIQECHESNDIALADAVVALLVRVEQLEAQINGGE